MAATPQVWKFNYSPLSDNTFHLPNVQDDNATVLDASNATGQFTLRSLNWDGGVILNAVAMTYNATLKEWQYKALAATLTPHGTIFFSTAVILDLAGSTTHLTVPALWLPIG